ncbi:MAG: hypothetical protein K2N42_00845 [Anaeroplasmataceae bacterium]|nr:hypothetical protein [Anaeroplasmataceae bacterium]
MPFFPNRMADVEVIIKNERPSKSVMKSGYRPAFKVKSDYLTTGVIKFIDIEELRFSEEAIAVIWFITPQFYPNCLEVGQTIPFQEGKMVHGYATITKINNKVLERKISQ